MAKADQLDLTSTVVRSADSISADAEGETVMMNLESSSYYGLDSIGSRVWELLAAPTTVAQICATLQQEYEVDADTCQRDVIELIQDMIDEQLAYTV